MVVQDTGTVGIAAYRVRFEHSTDGVLFSTPEGRITAVNPAACALLDMSADEICRLGCEGLVDQDDPRWKLAIAERDRVRGGRGTPAPGRWPLHRLRDDGPAVPRRGRLRPGLQHPARHHQPHCHRTRA